MSRTTFRSLMVVLVLGLGAVPGMPASVHAATAKIRVVFVGHNSTGTWDIFAGDTDGTGLVNLTHDSNVDLNPSVSPDGTKVLWTSQRQGNWDVYEMNADGTGVKRLTIDPGVDSAPIFSPDGTKIAFTSTRAGSPDIWIMNADGSSQKQLTSDGAPDDWPRFSPDGTKITYQSSQGGNDDIWIMNADGTGQADLTNNSASDLHPAWSPDGTKIAFDTNRDGNREVYTMNADGSSQTNITNSSYTEEFPSFTADGTHLAFDSNQPPPGAAQVHSPPSGSPAPDPGQCFEGSKAQLWLEDLAAQARAAMEWETTITCQEEPYVAFKMPNDDNIDLGTPGFNDLPPVPQGQGFGGNVDVGGTGPADGTNTQLHASWPPGTTYVGYQYRASGEQRPAPSISHCPVSGRTATCRLGTLSPGRKVKLLLRFRAGRLPAGVNKKTIVIVFRVTSSTPDPRLANNTRKVRVTIVRH